MSLAESERHDPSKEDRPVVITEMIRETEDCPMWRSDPHDYFGPTKNRMDLPMPWGPKMPG